MTLVFTLLTSHTVIKQLSGYKMTCLMGFSRLRHSRAMSVLSGNLSTFPSFSITALGCYRLTWTCIHTCNKKLFDKCSFKSQLVLNWFFRQTGSYSLRPIFLKLPLSSRIDMSQKNVHNDLMVWLLLHCLFFSSLSWWSCPIVITIWGAAGGNFWEGCVDG